MSFFLIKILTTSKEACKELDKYFKINFELLSNIKIAYSLASYKVLLSLNCMYINFLD